MTDRELIGAAVSAMERAYAPYSGFAVGAALETEGGEVYTGCNIENAAYGTTICAERVAFFAAVSAGERDFRKIALAGGRDGVVRSFTWPCGECRQVMREFCGDEFLVLAFDGEEIRSATLAALLPESFSPRDLGQ